MTPTMGIALLLWILIGAVLNGIVGIIIAIVLYFVGKALVEDLASWINN